MPIAEVLKNFLRKEEGGENMKYLGVILGIVTFLFCVFLDRTEAIEVKATITSGTSLPTPVMLKCLGYKATNPTTFNPWDTNNCPVRNLTSMDFGTLTTRLYDSNGNDIGGADCFYARDFFVIYLYPDAWGGKGYVLSSTASFADPDFQKAVVFTPVYSAEDSYGTNPQGDLTNEEKSWNPDINKDKLAQGGPHQILKAKRGRIVRAQYSIPPKPGTGQTRPSGWQAIPLTKTAGTYSGTVTISLTEWQ